MIQLDKEENTAILKRSADLLKRKGYENIKVDLDGFESPTTFKKSDSKTSFTPDIVAYRDGKKHYFEVSLKSEKRRLLKSKWTLLDTLSKIRNHRFKIITTRGHFKFTNELLSELNFDKKLIKV